jgi:hypothetical protein
VIALAASWACNILDDADWAEADRLSLALEQHAARAGGLAPSVAARKAGTPDHPTRGRATVYARWLLDRLVERQFAHTTGNGTRTRYWPGRP